MVILILISFVVVCLAFDAVLQLRRKNKAIVVDQTIESKGFFLEKSIVMPKGLFFDKSHTWAFMDPGGLVKVGVDDFLQKVTGKFTRLEMLSPGMKVKKGDPVLTLIQDGKKIYVKAPVNGKVVARNENLVNNIDPLYNSPYELGWVYMIEPANWLGDAQFLMIADKASDWLKTEISRLREFLAMAFSDKTLKTESIILQDGGEIKDHTLKDMGPDIWEDFQVNFLNKA